MPISPDLQIMIDSGCIDRFGSNFEELTEICNILRESSRIININLAVNNISVEAINAVTNSIKTNSILTELALQSSRMDVQFARIVADILKTNSTLQQLELRVGSIGTRGVRAIAGALKTNTTLTALNLPFNSIGTRGVRAIAGALKTSRALMKLNLYSTEIGPKGASAIADALRNNSILTMLDLSWGSIGPKGACAIADALRTNSTLMTLNLCWNGLGTEGAVAIAIALQNNNALTTLDLSANNIGIEGGLSLAGALKASSNLRMLNLSNNDTRGYVFDLANALENNNALTTLDLSFSGVDTEGASDIADALKLSHNSTIQEIRGLLPCSATIEIGNICQTNKKLFVGSMLSRVLSVDVSQQVLKFLDYIKAPTPEEITAVTLMKKAKLASLNPKVDQIEKAQIASVLLILPVIKERLNLQDTDFENITKYPSENLAITSQICKLAKDLMNRHIKAHKFTNKMVIAISTRLLDVLTTEEIRKQIDVFLGEKPSLVGVTRGWIKTLFDESPLKLTLTTLVERVIQEEIENKKTQVMALAARARDGVEESKGEEVLPELCVGPHTARVVEQSRAGTQGRWH